MATYTIQILNNSGFAKSYVAFMKPPIVTGSGGNPQVYTNAWATFPSITNNGFDSVTYTDTTYAYWGATPEELSPGTVMSWGGTALVDTGQQDSVEFSGEAPYGFGPVTHGGAMTGSYRIIAEQDFTAASGFVFGMAKAGQTAVPAPVATFLAQPNDTFNVTPVVQFYVADGSYTAGEVIDVSVTSTQSAMIDFTGLPQTVATVIQNANGGWTVEYS